MTRPVITIELSGVGSLVRGYRARDLCEQATGRAPVYIPRLGGYSCQERTARDVMALAETRGYDVVVTGARTRKAALLDALMAAPTPQMPEPGAGLW